MTYSVKEIFMSVQGEGAQTGRPSVFVRFSGCNLWSGREQDRAKAVCKFCDTDFVGTDGLGGGPFKTAEDLAAAARGFWPHDLGEPWVICTGGEPLLQLDDRLIRALREVGFKIAVETNGTIKAPLGIDWLCVSPKADADLLQDFGDELKLVFPQSENRPEDFVHLDFKVLSLQPKEDASSIPNTEANAQACFTYVTQHPNWRLSLQTHKWIDVR